MSRVVLSERHSPYIQKDVLGCNGFNRKDDYFCLIATKEDGSDGTRYINDGIVENSILYVNKKVPFENDRLNVFIDPDGNFELSTKRKTDKTYFGRVIMTINQYD